MTKKAEPSYIRVLFYKEPEYMLGNISTKDQSDFKTRPSRSLYQIARGSGGYTQRGVFFSSKRYTPREDLKKRYTVSL